MNIYVETNFILELAFAQEQLAYCEHILELCELGKAKLAIPAYSLVEPHEKLYRQAKDRKKLQESLDPELLQLSRSASYKTRLQSIQDIASLLVQSNEEEQQRFTQYRNRLFKCGEIIALTIEILTKATSYETTHGLKPQDAIVYASVIDNLRNDQPSQSLLLTKNSKDFNSPDIVDELDKLNCKIIFKFDQGYSFLQAQL